MSNVHKHGAKWYWDKYHIAETAWHRGLETLDEHSSPILVAELLAVHKLMEVLEECAHKIEAHELREPQQVPMHMPNPRMS